MILTFIMSYNFISWLCRYFSIRPKVITKSGANSASEIGLNAISNMNNGRGAGAGAVPNLVVPQIGGRNRSLPNLSKQNSGPNSSRSQGDRK